MDTRTPQRARTEPADPATVAWALVDGDDDDRRVEDWRPSSRDRRADVLATGRHPMEILVGSGS